MEGLLSALWSALTAAGSSLAAILVLAIAVGIVTLALLFTGSAVVVLERFARTQRRTPTLLAVAAVWTLGVGLVSAYTAPQLDLAWVVDRVAGGPPVSGPQLVDAHTPNPTVVARLPLWAAVSGTALVLLAALRLLLPRIGSWTLAVVTVAALGSGYALVLGGSASLLNACAPLAVCALLALVLAWRRRRSGRREEGEAPRAPGEIERLLRILALPLAVGAALAAALPEPSPWVALPGVLLLGAFSGLVLLGMVPLAAAGLIDTRGSVEWFIAARYLVAKRRQTFISIITGICVVGIAAGVWLIIVVLSVMNGFERTWREEIIGNRAHFTVQNGLGPFEDYQSVLEVVKRSPDVVAAAPFLDAEGMVRNAGSIMAVRVRGVDPERVGDVTDLRSDVVRGSLESLGQPVGEGEDPAIVVGSQLALHLGLAVGDELLVISPFGGPQTPLGPAPRLTRFRVGAIFESSFFQYDEMFTYVSLDAARSFRRVGAVVDGIEVRTTDPYRSQQLAFGVEQAVKAEFGPLFYTRDWKEFFPAFFQALKSERVMMFVLLAMIMVVAAFAIVSTLVMMIMEKSSDIAILKAMGATDDTIERIFAIEGTLIGLVGTLIGVVAAISVTARIDWIQRQIEDFTGIDTLPASVYQISTLPAELDLGQIVVSVLLAMVLSLGATLLPSRQGARLEPVEALRYE